MALFQLLSWICPRWAILSFQRLLLILFTVFSNKAIFNTIIRYLHLFITLIYSGLSVSEILLYREWQAKIGYDSLRHFANVSEVIKTPSISMALFL
jgi:hypothetical protein